MSENNTINTNHSDKNKLIVEGITLLLLLAVLVFFLYQCSVTRSNDSSTSGTIAPNAPYKVDVQNEQGNITAVIDSTINFKDIDFSSSIEKIKKLESKSKDTLDPSVNDSFIATSQDGYTYLTYKFNADAAPSAFGVPVNTNDSSAEIMYVFRGVQLIEVRWQYGSLSKDSFDTIISTITSMYGDSTYSREYTNGSLESWWKNSEVTLSAIYQGENGTSIYYRYNQ